MKLWWILVVALSLGSCHNIKKIVKRSGPKKSLSRILKSHDYEYKKRMAEQFFVKKKYIKAQQVYEDIFPYFKTDRVAFEDIYYKYAYCAYYIGDYMNAENLFKSFMETFPNSSKSEEVDYMRAYSFYKQSPKPELDQTQTIKAIGTMQVFINTHPGSSRIPEANKIIEECRNKLEIKEYKSAQLYFDMGQFRASGVAFSSLLNSFPDSQKADEYKLMAIKSYYKYAGLSVEEKQVERYEEVITHCNEFIDQFPESKLRNEVEEFSKLSNNNIKKLSNEQTKTAP
ncbi:MAG: outer membrane protein assembly factor BamD [Bacteroidetes bacterium]|nr:outer membrane protein assembly factor BamD [Bacteroidota bacterium]